MKRTRKMMLATLMATTAIAMLMMSKAFAAPAGFAGSTCPTQDQINKLMNSVSANLPTSGTVTSADIQKLLDQYGVKAPATTGSIGSLKSADLQKLLDQYGVKIPAANGIPTAKDCPKATPKATPVPTATLAPMTSPEPTATPAPTATPKPTATPAPTATPKPTATVAPTATPKPTATPAPSAPSGSMSSLEQSMINMVNQERTNAGLKALVFDATLRMPALKHSQDMSQNNFFSHTSPTYGTFSQRLKASGVTYSTAGENLAMYNSVEKAHVGLMNSEGHRANIMNANYTRIGIGIVYNQNKGVYYITQWFAK